MIAVRPCPRGPPPFSRIAETLENQFAEITVQRTARLAQQRAIGGILYERVLEQVACR
jgi:hypothetical protein